jgi:hypothetical protein
MGRFDENAGRIDGRWAKKRTRMATVAVLALVVAVVLVVGLTLPGDNDQPQEQAPSAEPVGGTPTPTPTLTLTPTPTPAQAVVPTTLWVNFYSLESTLDGQPLPVGAVIRAYDSQGVACGEFSVTHAGSYGLMPVYADDLLTEVDEGAVPGDRIEFTVSGIAATVTGPDEPVWGVFGDLKQVNLSVATSP